MPVVSVKPKYRVDGDGATKYLARRREEHGAGAALEPKRMPV